MRAHWKPDLIIQEDYQITGESLHHLAQVVRIKIGEDLLLLNGKGICVLTSVVSITKKEMRLKFRNSNEAIRKYDMSLVLGMPKKEALELSLKQAVELGMHKIFLIKSDYSQMRVPDEERLNNLLVSALEQSNAPYLPEVIFIDWINLAWEQYEEVLLLDSQSGDQSLSNYKKITGPTLLAVGPEGGFSPKELEFLRNLKNVSSLTLPTPIMRTPTALAVGAGILLQRLLD